MEPDDSFTEKLIQRTQARREYIRNKKRTNVQSVSVKRPALIEEQQIPGEDDGSISDSFEESPKRQCLEDVNADSSSDEDDKENSFCQEKEPFSFVPVQSNETARGLAALKKKNYGPSGTAATIISHQTDPQETEMIANSPAKYMPEIPENITKNSDKNDNDIEMEDVEASNFKEPVNKPCTVEKINSVSVSENKPNLFRLNQNQSGSNFQSRPSVPSISENTDPAELPLSARKALFERAFFGDSPKVNDDVFEPKLSVAQRAAMFEKASMTKNASPKKASVSCNRFTSPAASPVKFVAPDPVNGKSPMKSITGSPKPKSVNTAVEFRGSPMKQPPAVNSTPSPSKSVGSHTRLVQQQLIENANTNWQQNEIVSKSAEQRKSELSNLVNHWEKMSSSSSNSESANSGGLSQCDQRSSNENFEPVFQNSHENYEPGTESEEEYEDSEISKNENEEDRSEMDYRNTDIKNESTKRQISYSKIQSDDAKNAVTVCDELDEMLDSSLVQSQEQKEPERKFLFPEVLKSNSYSSNGSNGSTMDEKPDCFTQVTPGSSQSESNPDVPLLYTISFYRKKQQEGRTTPVRTIVRREQILSPPSPEVDKTAMIQERIKALQEEILMQQTVISQTSQALNLCHATAEFSGSIEQVEGERLLLIATQKRQACLNEVQRLKTQGSQNEFISDGTGTLTISDVQLLLKPEFMASELQSKSSDTVHYFLCLFRYGPQVIVSQMLSTNDPVSDGALCFTNHIKIQNLPADFSVVFEVYALQTKRDTLPHEKKYHIRKDHSKIRLTPKGKRTDSKILLPAVSSPGGPNAVRTPSFGVVGYTRFTIQNFSKKVFTLDKVPFVSPLNGVLKAKIRLHAEHIVVEKGFLTMFEDVSGFGAWHRRWCVLDGPSLSYWKYPDDEKKKEPIGVIDLKQCVTSQIRLVSRDVCARAHTFEVVTVRPQAKGDKTTLISRSVNTLTTTKHLISADTKEERILWCNKLNDALTNLRKWDPQALRPIEVKYNK